MINTNFAFIRNNKTDNKQLNKDSLELKAKSAAMQDLRAEMGIGSKLAPLNADTTEFSYKKKDEDFDALEDLLDEPLDDDVEDEILLEDEFSGFDNFFRDYELENDEDRSRRLEMGEFYYEPNYDENDVPLSENLKPYRQLSRDLAPNRFAHDTDLDYESKHALNRMNYANRIYAGLRSKDDHSNVSEIAELAASLAEDTSRNYADRCVDLSALRLGDGRQTLDSNLFRFVSKHPGHRKHVVTIDQNKDETYNPSYGRAYSRMLDETNDVKTIKDVLSSGVIIGKGFTRRQDPVLTSFAVDVFKKTHNWGEPEKNLIDSVKIQIKNFDKDTVIEEMLDNSKLRKAQSLLKSNNSIEECLEKLDEK